MEIFDLTYFTYSTYVIISLTIFVLMGFIYKFKPFKSKNNIALYAGLFLMVSLVGLFSASYRESDISNLVVKNNALYDFDFEVYKIDNPLFVKYKIVMDDNNIDKLDKCWKINEDVPHVDCMYFTNDNFYSILKGTEKGTIYKEKLVELEPDKDSVKFAKYIEELKEADLVIDNFNFKKKQIFFSDENDLKYLKIVLIKFKYEDEIKITYKDKNYSVDQL